MATVKAEAMEVDEAKSSSTSGYVDKIVGPGDTVLDLTKLGNQTLRLGGGLRQALAYLVKAIGFILLQRGITQISLSLNTLECISSDDPLVANAKWPIHIHKAKLSLYNKLQNDCDYVTVTKVGRLRYKKPNKYWVEGSHKRYTPCVEDKIIGIVVDCRSENFLVDIKGPMLAFLPVLAFEGGTRRNIPKFETGALIYVRVVKANRDMNPELSCTDASGKASEFGGLTGGYMFESSTGLARALLSKPTCPVLEELGKSISFEIAAGLNGRVWVNAPSPSTVILVSNAIMNAEYLSGVQQKIMVQRLLQRVQ